MSDFSSGGRQATIVITTKNRKDDLREAVRSALEQTASVEVLVIDDGSTDGTSEMIRSEFPEVILYRFEPSEGYIVQRNRGAELASTPIIFSIDDDAIFSSPHIVAQTLTEFDHPRVGAVAIPYIDVRKSDKINQLAPGTDKLYITDGYIGTAHAVKRDLFLRLQGYRQFLFHQGEEIDYCVRMLNVGYVTRLGRADPIHHFESPLRDRKRMDIYGPRNSVLYAWYNVPMPYCPIHMLGTSIKGLIFGCGRKHGHPWRVLWGLVRGYAASIHEFSRRQPIHRQVYRLSRELKQRGPLPLQEVEDRLRPLAETRSSLLAQQLMESID